jgi:NitT/TauT family transport system permease protein
VMLRLVSLVFLVGVWHIAFLIVGERMLPGPLIVLAAVRDAAASGTLFLNLGITLGRVLAAFALAMFAGTVLGLLMGRVTLADRIGDPWLVLLLNLPALVIIVLAYVWGGLTEIAGIAAVAINKLPNTIVTVREGARALDRTLEEMAAVFAMSRYKTFRHVVLPQMGPYIAAAARSGISLVWKIVLVVEFLGRPNGVGFEIGIAFQLFDVTGILAYALVFVAVMFIVETILVQPLERRAARWRIRPA